MPLPWWEKIATVNSYDAYIVGGCLRDLLCQGKPPKDFDGGNECTSQPNSSGIPTSMLLLSWSSFPLAHIMFGRDVIEVATFRASHSDARSENQAKTKR